jgi:hypothetical protein
MKKKKKHFTLILVASAPKPVATDNSPNRPTTLHNTRAFLSISRSLSLPLSLPPPKEPQNKDKGACVPLSEEEA